MTKRFSALQRAEIAEIKYGRIATAVEVTVSVLFNEPKLLKCTACRPRDADRSGFSALQRAEIAEIGRRTFVRCSIVWSFSALQRAEIAEIKDMV